MLTKFVCPGSAYAAHITLNPNDLVTVLIDSTEAPVMIYNHTLELSAYQKTNFYKQAFQVKDFIKLNMLAIIISFFCLLSMILSLLAPFILLASLNSYGNNVVRKLKDQECENITDWIRRNINTKPPQIQPNIYHTI